MSDTGVELEIAALLTIDIDAELRKLTQAQLQGAWQLPAELVRRALRAGARVVDVHIERDRITVEDDGAPVGRATLDHLATLLTPARAASDRHAALIELENAGDLELLAVVGTRVEELEIVTPAPDDVGWLLGWRRRDASAPGERVRRFAPPAPRTTRVSLRGVRAERSRARTWLQQVARFAKAQVLLDGRPIRRGFADPLLRRSLSAPLDGELAIPAEGEDARLWLLRDGLITAQLTIPDAPCFEAVVETGGLAVATTSAASLRDAITPFIPEILDQAVLHLVELGERAPLLAPTVRTRAIQLLLQAARRRIHSAVIARLPLFRGVEIDDGGERYFDLLALRQAVVEGGNDRHLLALFPDQDPRDFANVGRIFILDERERGLLHDLLDLQFRPPPRRTIAGHRLAHLGHAIRETVGNHGRELRDVLRAWVEPRHHEVNESDLDAEERRCLAVLREVADGRAITICEGSGRVRRRRDRLSLPRDNPEVRSCVAAIAHDPAWAYPALLALLAGQEYPSAARRAWSLRAGSR